MTGPDRSALYTACRASVSALLEMHASQDDVERRIEALPLACEEQSALWLGPGHGRPANGAATNGEPPDAESRRQIVTDRLIALG